MTARRREAYLVLTLLPRIGPVTIRRLIEALGSPEDVLGAPAAKLREVDGVGPALAGVIASWEDQVDLAREKRRIRETGARFLTREDDEYPPLLHEVPDAPTALYVLGAIEDRDRHGVAVVGSRRATHYGSGCARRLAFQLAAAGITVTSGLARGIDSAAHRGALEAKGRTIAVLGSGVGQIYPPENTSLAEEIMAGNGAVISEFPVDMIPDKTTFPLRNRVVAGMSRGLLVVECPAWSGALITANLATDYNRGVYAVPGPVDRPSSEGCHRLIQDGAKLVTSAEDILEDFSWLLPPSEAEGVAASRRRHEEETRPSLNGEESLIYEAMAGTEMQMEEIIERTGLSSSSASATLLRMEMRGLVKQLPGQHFTRLV